MNKTEKRLIEVTGEEMQLIMGYAYKVSQKYERRAKLALARDDETMFKNWSKLFQDSCEDIDRFRTIWEDGNIIGYTE